jgi:signal transduction histidine kinase
MESDLFWALVATTDALLSIGAAAAAWCILRASRSAESLALAGSVTWLALHYVSHAVGAFRIPSAPVSSVLSPWAALGQLALVISGALFVLFLLCMLRRVATPRRLDPVRVVATLACVVGSITVAGWYGLVVTESLIRQGVAATPPFIVERLVGWTLGIPLAATGFVLPLFLLRTPFDDLARRDAAFQGARGWRRGGAAPATTFSMSEWTTEDHWRAVAAPLFLTVAWITSVPLGQQLGWNSPSLAVGRALLLPGLLAAVFFHARFVFLDGIVRRGLAWGATAIVVVVAMFVMVPAIIPRVAWDQLGLLAVGVVVATIALGGVREHVSRWLQGIIFGRVDHDAELAALAESMARSVTRDEALAALTSHLTDALDAEYVLYREAPRDGAVAVSIGALEGRLGYLCLGPRRHHQPYSRDDLAFVSAAGAQLNAYLQVRDTRRTLRLATKAELRALQAQIHPHFLFNTLTTVAEMVRPVPAAERTVLNLAHVCRHALEASQCDRVPLGAEIDTLRAYLELESERVDHAFAFDIDVPDQLREIPMPPLLLQPLVENAITHGISGRSEGTVRVRVVHDRSCLRFTVEDDGVGFDVTTTSYGVGLSNVAERVERIGGTCDVRSTRGIGTCITVTVAA